MFRRSKQVILLAMFSATLLLAGGCDKEDAPAQNKSYTLLVKDELGVTGKVTFTETSSTSTTVDIVLTNAPVGMHPANLYMYSTVEDGAVIAALNPVDATGKSSSLLSNMSYSELIAYDACVRVLKSSSESNIILAQGDIGGNVITSNKKSYTLSTVGVFGVSGTALFEKRENGNTLVTISIIGAIHGGIYPATINLGSVATIGGGPVKKTLNNVDGTTGKSYTNIRKLNDGTVVTYDNWLNYDGYINVYQSPSALEVIISQGDIGSN